MKTKMKLSRAVQILLMAVFVFSLSACRTKPPARYAPPESILGKGRVSSAELAAFLVSANPLLDRQFAADFARWYVEESAVEGINHDIAFSQMCVETGFMTFGGLVTADMNNFCGLGSIGPGQPGERFPTPRIGIRAQIQHLKAYATSEPPKLAIVDPRYHWVKPGAAVTIDGLAGRWASDKEYAVKIKAVLERLYASSGNSRRA
ncbi:MAG: glucosaminidase domain-containing protein [Spirochaetaceae bacterium]|jgi:hypothetical protein|nr:glucosaminidase domain-containing protein [Spirochaetaceae bacterium]